MVEKPLKFLRSNHYDRNSIVSGKKHCNKVYKEKPGKFKICKKVLPEKFLEYFEIEVKFITVIYVIHTSPWQEKEAYIASIKLLNC